MKFYRVGIVIPSREIADALLRSNQGCACLPPSASSRRCPAAASRSRRAELVRSTCSCDRPSVVLDACR